MHLRAGYEIAFDCSAPTSMLLQVAVHPSRTSDLLTPGIIVFDPPVSVSVYQDTFENCCTRIVAPPGRLTLSTRFDVYDSGLPDPVAPGAMAHPVEDLPADMLVFLLGSRYCETDRLSEAAWSLFGHLAPGWARVQAICDFVHARIRFSYPDARETRTAWEAYQEQIGVCRDYAHLAVAF